MSEKITIETPFTVEDLTETTDESFTKKIISYAKEWIEEELRHKRYDMKEAIRDHYAERPWGIR